MSTPYLVNLVTQIKSPITLVAFALVCIVTVFKTSQRRGPRVAQNLVIATITAMCVIAILPLFTDTLSSKKLALSVFRVRVTALDGRNVPIRGAAITVNALVEAHTAPDGSCELAIPKATLSKENTITVYAQSGDLHGSSSLKLENDANPQLNITLREDLSAGVSGLVEDDSGAALQDAMVVTPGMLAVRTGSDGTFNIASFAAPGRIVRLHIEKKGYRAIDADVRAGQGPNTFRITAVPRVRH